ncbi:hypothetical protein FA95DRAFT_1482376 [Auriscalpium vulgare]|uniref:Uncharacterized protein n=1 Tax=Auriscalpium vulgare TaxID=40419 RepID=A0ACB8SAM1_9AGAM|nr:hypothetical protein FA95DRAFT_1482376 [Auriscalpium vulgare]
MDVEPLLDATLRRVDKVVNEDVEMQPPPSERHIYFVVDTNVVLHHLDVLQQFVADVEALPIELPLLLLVPGIVISELDHQKNRADLAWAARRASTWLLEKVKERRSVRGQAHEETCKQSGKWNVRDQGEVGFPRSGPESNDDLIIDCCRYFAGVCFRAKSGRVVLCSADKNICFKSESLGLQSISPSRFWTSREIADALYGNLGNEARHFDHYPSRTSREAAKADPNHANSVEQGSHAGDDQMDVDSEPETYIPSHPLDALHLEVIEHFSPLLSQLVDRVGGADVPRTRSNKSALTRSVHAPSWSRAALPDWTASDCVGYLVSKKGIRGDRQKLEMFLTKPGKKERGCRAGQNWTRAEWGMCAALLGEIGGAWEDRAVQESVAVLRPYAEGVFGLQLRPTGT